MFKDVLQIKATMAKKLDFQNSQKWTIFFAWTEKNLITGELFYSTITLPFFKSVKIDHVRLLKMTTTENYVTIIAG